MVSGCVGAVVETTAHEDGGDGLLVVGLGERIGGGLGCKVSDGAEL